jgi:hypothetical protein
MVVWIQCFNFSLRGEAIGQTIVGRWSGDGELLLAQWEGSVTRFDGVTTSTRGDAALRRGKGGEDAS